MSRDFSSFPDDETGDVLWAMQQKGDDLSRPREIEFTVVFATENEALNFGETLLFNRQKVLICDSPDSIEFPFEVVVYVDLSLSHKNITDYQSLLDQYAAPLNGHNDGWGCLA